MNKDVYTRAKAKGEKSPVGVLLTRLANARLSVPARVALYAASLVMLVVVSNLFQDTLYGSILILLYGFLSLILRVKSENTFRMVLILLAYLAVLVKIRNELLAENFAQYAFLLLIFGVIRIIVEERQRRPKAMAKGKSSV